MERQRTRSRGFRCSSTAQSHWGNVPAISGARDWRQKDTSRCCCFFQHPLWVHRVWVWWHLRLWIVSQELPYYPEDGSRRLPKSNNIANKKSKPVALSVVVYMMCAQQMILCSHINQKCAFAMYEKNGFNRTCAVYVQQLFDLVTDSCYISVLSHVCGQCGLSKWAENFSCKCKINMCMHIVMIIITFWCLYLRLVAITYILYVSHAGGRPLGPTTLTMETYGMAPC